MQHWGILLVILYRSFSVVGSVSQSEIDRHLELGREFLAKGQLQDALTHYHAAVDGDANNYLTYYKRGTVFLALGKAKQALLDLNKVLELKPDFTAARLRKSSVLFKRAEFDLAEEEAYKVLSVDPHNEDALDIISKIEPNRHSLYVAEDLMRKEMHAEAADAVTRVIEFCPWSSRLRELRAEAYEAMGDYMNAISDIRSTTKLLSDNTQGFYKVAFLLYQLGHVDDSLKEIRECVKLDPDHPKCLPFYRMAKKVAKKLNDANDAEESKDYDKCINGARQVLTLETQVDNVRFLAHHLLCKCQRGKPDIASAIRSCEEALEITREPGVLCDSAEANLAGDMYDDALRDVKDALEIDPSSHRAKELQERIKRAQKLSETRDYYKILNVKKTATKEEITKAYRKAAQKWHPDRFQEASEKKMAEKKFMDIAAAKEVLTDETMRKTFDGGHDPLDPESGQQKSHFQDFSHFHGSPFQFKFHFN